MSIYTTPISQLKPSDLDELLQEQAVENTRLEFKREVPEKDETLKKLSDSQAKLDTLIHQGRRFNRG